MFKLVLIVILVFVIAEEIAGAKQKAGNECGEKHGNCLCKILVFHFNFFLKHDLTTCYKFVFESA